MTGYLHLLPISKTWIISYHSNSFTTTQIPIILNLELNKRDHNKKVEFEILNLNGADHGKISKLGRKYLL
jgi:hypothetical protein